MTEESERRKRKGEEVGEVTDEESAEQWLVEKKRGRIHRVAAEGE